MLAVGTGPSGQICSLHGLNTASISHVLRYERSRGFAPSRGSQPARSNLQRGLHDRHGHERRRGLWSQCSPRRFNATDPSCLARHSSRDLSSSTQLQGLLKRVADWFASEVEQAKREQEAQIRAEEAQSRAQQPRKLTKSGRRAKESSELLAEDVVAKIPRVVYDELQKTRRPMTQAELCRSVSHRLRIYRSENEQLTDCITHELRNRRYNRSRAENGDLIYWVDQPQDDSNTGMQTHKPAAVGNGILGRSRLQQSPKARPMELDPIPARLQPAPMTESITAPTATATAVATRKPAEQKGRLILRNLKYKVLLYNYGLQHVKYPHNDIGIPTPGDLCKAVLEDIESINFQAGNVAGQLEQSPSQFWKSLEKLEESWKEIHYLWTRHRAIGPDDYLAYKEKRYNDQMIVPLAKCHNLVSTIHKNGVTGEIGSDSIQLFVLRVVTQDRVRAVATSLKRSRYEIDQVHNNLRDIAFERLEFSERIDQTAHELHRLMLDLKDADGLENLGLYAKALSREVSRNSEFCQRALSSIHESIIKREQHLPKEERTITESYALLRQRMLSIDHYQFETIWREMHLFRRYNTRRRLLEVPGAHALFSWRMQTAVLQLADLPSDLEGLDDIRLAGMRLNAISGRGQRRLVIDSIHRVLRCANDLRDFAAHAFRSELLAPRTRSEWDFKQVMQPIFFYRDYWAQQLNQSLDELLESGGLDTASFARFTAFQRRHHKMHLALVQEIGRVDLTFAASSLKAPSLAHQSTYATQRGPLWDREMSLVQQAGISRVTELGNLDQHRVERPSFRGLPSATCTKPVLLASGGKAMTTAIRTILSSRIVGIDAVVLDRFHSHFGSGIFLHSLTIVADECVVIISQGRNASSSNYLTNYPELYGFMADSSIIKVGQNLSRFKQALVDQFGFVLNGFVDIPMPSKNGTSSDDKVPTLTTVHNGSPQDDPLINVDYLLRSLEELIAVPHAAMTRYRQQCLPKGNSLAICDDVPDMPVPLGPIYLERQNELVFRTPLMGPIIGWESYGSRPRDPVLSNYIANVIKKSTRSLTDKQPTGADLIYLKAYLLFIYFDESLETISRALRIPKPTTAIRCAIRRRDLPINEEKQSYLSLREEQENLQHEPQDSSNEARVARRRGRHTKRAQRHTSSAEVFDQDISVEAQLERSNQQWTSLSLDPYSGFEDDLSLPLSMGEEAEPGLEEWSPRSLAASPQFLFQATHEEPRRNKKQKGKEVTSGSDVEVRRVASVNPKVKALRQVPNNRKMKALRKRISKRLALGQDATLLKRIYNPLLRRKRAVLRHHEGHEAALSKLEDHDNGRTSLAERVTERPSGLSSNARKLRSGRTQQEALRTPALNGQPTSAVKPMAPKSDVPLILRRRRVIRRVRGMPSMEAPLPAEKKASRANVLDKQPTSAIAFMTPEFDVPLVQSSQEQRKPRKTALSRAEKEVSRATTLNEHPKTAMPSMTPESDVPLAQSSKEQKKPRRTALLRAEKEESQATTLHDHPISRAARAPEPVVVGTVVDSAAPSDVPMNPSASERRRKGRGKKRAAASPSDPRSSSEKHSSDVTTSDNEMTVLKQQHVLSGSQSIMPGREYLDLSSKTSDTANTSSSSEKVTSTGPKSKRIRANVDAAEKDQNAASISPAPDEATGTMSDLKVRRVQSTKRDQ